MAEKRMFAKSIVLSDAFLDMPMSARCLYFTLNMFADDDGFVGSPKGIMRQCGSTEDDLKILIAKKYVLAFPEGILVIKHWRINNFLRKDRHTSTTYKEQLAMLSLDDKNAYTFNDGQPLVNQWSTQISIEENREDKISIDEIEEEKISKEDDVPYVEIIEYLNDKAHTRYKPSTNNTKSLIHARSKEGFSLDDFKTVIDKMVSAWTGTEYEQYLRPATLFGTKFEGYLNSNYSKSNKQNKYIGVAYSSLDLEDEGDAIYRQ